MLTQFIQSRPFEEASFRSFKGERLKGPARVWETETPYSEDLGPLNYTCQTI